MQNKLTLKKIAEVLEKLVRRVDSIEKNVDLLSTDERNILENINARLAAIEEQMQITRAHDDKVRKDIKFEIQSSGDRTKAAVETKIEEIHDQIENKKVVQVKKRFKWFWQK